MKKRVVLFLVLIVLVVSISALFSFLTMGRVEIKFEDEGVGQVDVFLGNKQLVAPTTLNGLRPGSYTVSTHVYGYAEYKENITILRGVKTTHTIKLQPLGTTQLIEYDSEKWNDYFEEESRKSNQVVQDREQQNPLTKLLPQFTTNYTLDYEIRNDNQIVYTIKTKNLERDIPEAKKWIRSQGINPDTINITVAE